MPYRTLDEILEDKISVSFTPKLSLSLTAEDWNLQGREEWLNDYRHSTAIVLNNRIINIVAESKTYDEAYEKCMAELRTFSSYQADKLGLPTLEVVLKSVFGEPD